MLSLICLLACATPPVLMPVADAPVKKVASAVRYARKNGPLSLRVAGPDTLVTTWTAPPGNGGSAVTGYDARSKKDNVIVQTDANLPPTTFTVRWVITGVGPGQTASLNACVNAKNAAGAGSERCSAPVSYTALDVVPLPPGSVTSIVVKLP